MALQCPDCGGVLFVSETILGGEGRAQFRIRKYQCEQCAHRWKSVERDLIPIASPRRLSRMKQEIEQQLYNDRITQQMVQGIAPLQTVDQLEVCQAERLQSHAHQQSTEKNFSAVPNAGEFADRYGVK